MKGECVNHLAAGCSGNRGRSHWTSITGKGGGGTTGLDGARRWRQGGGQCIGITQHITRGGGGGTLRTGNTEHRVTGHGVGVGVGGGPGKRMTNKVKVTFNKPGRSAAGHGDGDEQIFKRQRVMGRVGSIYTARGGGRGRWKVNSR